MQMDDEDDGDDADDGDDKNIIFEFFSFFSKNEKILQIHTQTPAFNIRLLTFQIHTGISLYKFQNP